jgi:hypothetical protein
MVSTERHFESIESAQEFVALLEQSIDDALAEVRADLDSVSRAENERHARALMLAVYKLGLLSSQVKKSGRILNDLRTIRRMLFAERKGEAHAVTAETKVKARKAAV